MFNIGEPVMYGLPTVLNPLMFIPFLLAPIVLSAVAYGATALGLVAPVTQNVTWVMPPVLMDSLQLVLIGEQLFYHL